MIDPILGSQNGTSLPENYASPLEERGFAIFRCSILLIFVLVGFISGCTSSQRATSSQNPEDLYHFFVAGHLYGNQSHADTSLLPYPDFLNALPQLKEDSLLQFGFLLGDQVQNPDEKRYQELQAQLSYGYSSPDFELYAVPGNHDIHWDAGTPLPGPFDDYFGARHRYFIHQGALFFLLDSNPGHWRIEDPQLKMIKQALQHNPKPTAVYIFVHNILWWDDDPSSAYNYPTPNSTWNRVPNVNFRSEILPLLQELPCPVYCFAGDTGNDCNGRELTYRKEENVRLITTGMGCRSRSNYLRIEVDKKGNARVVPVGIGDEPIRRLEDGNY